MIREERIMGRDYILMLSIHGLVRGQNPELGRDPDTGGQVSYVLELARALARQDRVDLVTRLVQDPKIDPIYAEPFERLVPRTRIVRLEFGPRRYLRKEVLWTHLQALTDRLIQHVRRMGRLPSIIHGHYADAGWVGSRLAQILGVPFVFTGHSLGHVKRQRLLAKGMTAAAIEKRYNMSQRIEAEELALENATLVVASTHQEAEEQYALYSNSRRSRMAVIPPGVDLDRFQPAGRIDKIAGVARHKPPIYHELNRFLQNPHKPMILCICRADERKNVSGLIRAYAGNSELRERANLVLVAGTRNRLRDLEPGARRVIGTLLRQIDDLDLHGHVAYPKRHSPADVPDLYRLAAASRGVFVNPALTEPFGLTLLEAAACGLPVVATDDGGPRDILKNCHNGLLIDPLDSRKMGRAILKALTDAKRWTRWSRQGLKGVRRHYSWDRHAETYVRATHKIWARQRRNKIPLGRRSALPTIDRLLISDIDNTLLGGAEPALNRLVGILQEQKGRVGFGVATGRRIDSAVKILKEHNVPTPDVFITAVGSEIHYSGEIVADTGWEKHLDYHWKPTAVREAIALLPGLKLQAKSEQRRYKISYDIEPRKAPRKREIVKHLRDKGLRVRVVHSHNAYLDILPIRASKGLAIRFIAFKWGLTMDRILVAGDSGNDIDMLSGDTLGVIVGNHDPEMKSLQGKARIIFADGRYAAGILEGIDHYHFLDEIQIPGEEPCARPSSAF
jgi:sucrose-phosphate synthase